MLPIAMMEETLPREYDSELENILIANLARRTFVHQTDGQDVRFVFIQRIVHRCLIMPAYVGISAARFG